MQLNLYLDADFDGAETPSDSVTFSAFEGNQAVESGTARLSELHNRIPNIDNCEITVILPGEQVVSQLIQAPKGSHRHLAQALPFILEDDLAAPVECLHIAFGEPSADGQILCTAIDKTLFENYLNQLSEAGISASKVIPDYWTLPMEDGLQMARKNQRLIVRRPTSEGMSLPANIDNPIITTLLPDATNEQLESAPEWQPAYIDLIPLNLLQGDFTAPRAASQFIWIRPTLIAASICFAVFVSYFLATGWYFNHKASELAEKTESAYKALFPNDKRIINIRRQMQAHLNQVGSGRDNSLFFELLNAFSNAKEQQNEPATVRSVRFDQNNASLQLELQTASMNYANNMQGHLQEKGLTAEVLSANSNAEGVIARLRIRAGAAQ